MDFESYYRIPDDDDMGCRDDSKYLLVNSVGYYRFRSHFRMSRRNAGRKDFYVSYNYEGPMTVYLEGQELHLPPGSLFVYRPHEEQHYGHLCEREFLAYWAHFTGYGAEELLTGSGLLEHNGARVGVDEELASVFMQIMNEVQAKKPGFELASASLLSYLVALLARRLHREADVRGEGQRHRQEIYDCIQFIHSHYAEEIYVGQLADRAHLSADRFTRLFKLVTGTTPQQYVLKYRLERACELMRRTELNIQQIAGLSGFDDQLYFTRMFKKRYRTTPSQYMARFAYEG